MILTAIAKISTYSAISTQCGNSEECKGKAVMVERCGVNEGKASFIAIISTISFEFPMNSEVKLGVSALLLQGKEK